MSKRKFRGKSRHVKWIWHKQWRWNDCKERYHLKKIQINKQNAFNTNNTKKNNSPAYIKVKQIICYVILVFYPCYFLLCLTSSIFVQIS